MGISEINMKLSSMAWTSSNGIKSGQDVRIFPEAGAETEVIGSFSRFAADAQQFEVVSQDGEIVVRPVLPDSSTRARSRYGFSDEDAVQLKAA